MKIERLELPSGGWVEFDDPDELTGGDYRKLRAQLDSGSLTSGTVMNAVYTTAAVVLVRAWQVPYLGQPMLPRVNPALLDQLRINDVKALDAHLRDFVNRYVFGTGPVVDDGDPTPPAGGSEPSSRETPAPAAPTPGPNIFYPTPSGTTHGSAATPAGPSPL